MSIPDVNQTLADAPASSPRGETPPGTQSDPHTDQPEHGGGRVEETTRSSSRTVQPLWRILAGKPLFVTCLVVFVLIALAVLAAPMIAPYDPLSQDLLSTFSTPSAGHLLGTDDLGRDVLSRMLHGGRATLLGVVQALAVFLVVGTSLGLVAGMSRGAVDTVITRLAELLLSIPGFILLLVILSILPGNMSVAMMSLGLLTSPLLIRVVRGTTRSVRSELFVLGARTMGLTESQVTFRHVLPRLAGPIIVQATIFSGTVIIAETGLGYLGFGVAPPEPSWGNMVQTASQNITSAPWLLLPTGGVITVTILALMFMGDSIRDAVAERWTGSGAGGGRRRSRRAAPQAVASTRPTEAEEGVAGSGAGQPAVLSVRDLTIVFDSPTGPITLVDGVSFDLLQGETLCLVGESGSGKSLTSLALLGLSRGTRVASGSIMVDGVDMALGDAAKARAVRGRMFGYITQDPQPSLDPSMRVGDLLNQLVRLHQGVSSAEAEKVVLELLERVRIPDPASVARKYPHQLSGGMAQRIVIAAALSARPRVLIADEPTTALDVTVQAEILALLHELVAQDDSMAMLLVTHDWGVVADIADRVVVMRQGQLVERAAAQDIFTNPRHPHTREMLAADPARLDIHAERPPAPVLLQVRDLVVAYQGRDSGGRVSSSVAVRGVDLDIRKGRTLGLIGESGSGKSSIGNAIIGLVQAQSGQLLLHHEDGSTEDLVRASAGRRRELTKDLQIIFQDPYGSLNPVRTIGSTLAEPLVLAHGMKRSVAEARVATALGRVGLERAAATRYPSQFSGGQRQRIAIARALVMEPKLIVCDEPVSALDLTVQRQVLELLSELQDEHDIALLFISHDLSVVRSFCDDVAVIYRGEIVENGSAQSVIGNPAHEYTRALLDAAPIPDPTVQHGRSLRLRGSAA